MLYPASVIGLTDDETALLSLNIDQLRRHQRQNLKRLAYFNGKKRLDQFGISIPPSMRDLQGVVRWPAKACTALSGRLHLEGFVVPGEAKVDPRLATIWARNRMRIEWPQAQISTFINGCSFGVVTDGDPGKGEPEVLLLMLPATQATGVWDPRIRQLTSAVWVEPEQRYRRDLKATLFTLPETIDLQYEVLRSGWVVRDRIPNRLPRLGVTPLTYQQNADMPLGSSRISDDIMGYTDSAVRTMLRTEVSAEFYSSPQRYVLGADETAFEDEEGNPIPAWESILGKVLALSRDENDAVPTVGQFPQMTMDPHIAQLRSIATMFAAAADLPVSSLGIIHDNPASADAIEATWYDLVNIAEQCQRELGVAAVEMAQNALLLANGTTLDDDLAMLESKWRDADKPTKQAQTQATIMQIQAGVLRPDSTVALEQLGYSETDIKRIQAEHEAARLTDPLSGVNALLNPTNVAGNAPVPA